MRIDLQPAVTALDDLANNLIQSKPELDEAERRTLRSYVDAITFLKMSNLGGLGFLVDLIRQWGLERNIIGPEAKATVDSQMEKLREEVLELRGGVARKDQHEIIDGIGDCTVVLILLANLAGVTFEKCLLAAYDEIKERKGTIVDGKFVKQSNQ